MKSREYMGNDIHFPRLVKSSHVKSSQSKSNQDKARQGKAWQAKGQLELVRVSNDPSRTHWHCHPHWHGVSSSNLKSQISNLKRAGPGRQWPKPRNRTKNQETSVHPCTRTRTLKSHPHPHPHPHPSPHPYPHPQTTPIHSRKNSKKPRKNSLKKTSKKPSKRTLT